MAKFDIKAIQGSTQRAMQPSRINYIPVPEEQIKEVIEALNRISQIPVSSIEPNPFNPRQDFEETAMQELATSLKVHGLVQPITVRSVGEGKYQLISGERRWRASQIANLVEIPAYIRDVENDQEMLEMALVENIQRENLNPIEEAITYQRLKEECKLTDEGLSERLGKGRATITNKLGLLKLAPSIIKAIREIVISEGHAKAIKGLENIDDQLVVLKEIQEKDLSVRATEQLVKSLKKKKPVKKTVNATRRFADEIREVEDEISAFFGVRVQIKYNEKGVGQVVIPFDSFDKLDLIQSSVKS